MFGRYPGFLAKTLAATVAGWMVFSAITIWQTDTGPSQDIARALLPAMIAIAAVFSLLVIYPVVIALTYWALGRGWARNPLVWIVAGAAGGAVVTSVFGLLMSGGYADAMLYSAMIGTVCGFVTAAVCYALFRHSLR